MSEYEIDVSACRRRQQRMIQQMQQLEVDLVIVTQAENIQWLTGARFGWFFQPAAALTAEGQLILVAPNEAPPAAAADEIRTYEAQWHSTLRNDQRQAASQALADAIESQVKGRTLGVEFSTFGRHVEYAPRNIVDVESVLYELRRPKDPDELALIKKAILGTQRMYERARAIIRPGVTELDVFNQLQATAVEEFGERLTGTGNDYQCGTRGGPPRNGRQAADGELYILDLGPAFRGYFADNCRTIAVTDVSDAQQEAWSCIRQVFEHVERTVRPGKNAQELFHEAQNILDQAPIGVFDHHLGHGFGLFPHEAPHLNPHWNYTFQEGEVFTAEPGLYAPELKGGMRLENNYQETEDGVQLLTHFPLELKVE